MTPEEVVEATFSALARSDAVGLEQLLDPESLSRLRAARLRAAEAWQRSSTINYHQLLGSYGIDSIEELTRLTTQEVLARSLNALPATRATLRCRILERNLDVADRVDLSLLLEWPNVAPVAGIVSTVLRNGEWKVVASPLNRWILPCFDNLLIPDNLASNTPPPDKPAQS